MFHHRVKLHQELIQQQQPKITFTLQAATIDCRKKLLIIIRKVFARQKMKPVSYFRIMKMIICTTITRAHHQISRLVKQLHLLVLHRVAHQLKSPLRSPRLLKKMQLLCIQLEWVYSLQHRPETRKKVVTYSNMWHLPKLQETLIDQ